MATDNENVNVLRWAGLCGIIGPFIALGFIFAAIATAPWWSFTDNSISGLAGGEGDRPIWTATGLPAVLLNTGLVVGGAVMVVFAYALTQSPLFERDPGRYGKQVFLVACVFMMLVGVVPLTLGLAHGLVSYPFFILNAVALVLVGASAMGTKGHRNIGRLLVFLGVFSLVPFLLPLGLKGIAIPEFMALMPLTFFSVVTGSRMFTLNQRKTK